MVRDAAGAWHHPGRVKAEGRGRGVSWGAVAGWLARRRPRCSGNGGAGWWVAVAGWHQRCVGARGRARSGASLPPDVGLRPRLVAIPPRIAPGAAVQRGVGADPPPGTGEAGSGGRSTGRSAWAWCSRCTKTGREPSLGPDSLALVHKSGIQSRFLGPGAPDAGGGAWLPCLLPFLVHGEQTGNGARGGTAGGTGGGHGRGAARA
jgi:hypothetical protein